MKIIQFTQNEATDIKFVNDSYVPVDAEVDVTESIILEDFIKWRITYSQIKDVYQYLGKNFNNLSIDLKTQVIIHCAISDVDCITYLMSLGHSPQDAKNIFIQNKAVDVQNLARVTTSNIQNPRLLNILFSYLSQAECERFLKETQQLIYFYSTYAVYGKKYGNSIDGILDFIEDYGIYVGTGLSTYSLNEGTTLVNFVAELKSYLTNNRCNIN